MPASEVEAGSGLVNVTASARVQGLTPGTVYHFRVIAKNVLGTVPGPDQVFTTQAVSMELGLPDDRQYELVSPPSKDGGEVGGMAFYSSGGMVQASEDGMAVTYLGSIPFSGAAPANTSGQPVRLKTRNSWLVNSEHHAARHAHPRCVGQQWRRI